ncbi:hypothetical protein Tco_0752687 [Tanacetum coccineum]|uniref:Uncharacterized protein n=1 Tax=Tanacetum coccineum TaxID=301880 RepID=A0ABQ4ZA69_9ASTR
MIYLSQELTHLEVELENRLKLYDLMYSMSCCMLGVTEEIILVAVNSRIISKIIFTNLRKSHKEDLKELKFTSKNQVRGGLLGIINDSFTFVHELKQEMHADLKYVESLKKEIDELESDKADFQTYAHNEVQCLYLHKVKECEYLAQKLSKQTESVSKEVYTEFLRSFTKLEKHSISLELTLQQCQEQMKDDTVCKEKVSNVFLKEHEQYFEIQDLKAPLQDKKIAISELKKLIEKCKGKSVETKKPSVVRKPNAQRILKP